MHIKKQAPLIAHLVGPQKIALLDLFECSGNIWLCEINMNFRLYDLCLNVQKYMDFFMLCFSCLFLTCTVLYSEGFSSIILNGSIMLYANSVWRVSGHEGQVVPTKTGDFSVIV